MEFKIFRTCDTFRIRKMVVELFHDGMAIDRTRMFGCFFPRLKLSRKMFAWRLQARKNRMLLSGEIQVQAMK